MAGTSVAGAFPLILFTCHLVTTFTYEIPRGNITRISINFKFNFKFLNRN